MLIEQLKHVHVVSSGMCYELYLCKRSIQRVEVVGTIVSKAIKSEKIILYIDDGSGILQCVKFYDERDYTRSLPFAHISLGDLVSIRGRLTFFNE